MEYSLKQFSFHKKSGVLTADASELGCRVGKVPGSQIWDDSCDYGIIVKSPTGKSYTFLFDFENDEGGCFVYEPYEVDCPINKVLVFND